MIDCKTDWLSVWGEKNDQREHLGLIHRALYKEPEAPRLTSQLREVTKPCFHRVHLSTVTAAPLKFHFRLTAVSSPGSRPRDRRRTPRHLACRCRRPAREGPEEAEPAAAFRCARVAQPIACSPAPRGRGEAGAGKRKKNIRPPPTSARAAAAAAPGSRTLTFH